MSVFKEIRDNVDLLEKEIHDLGNEVMKLRSQVHFLRKDLAWATFAILTETLPPDQDKAKEIRLKWDFNRELPK